MEKETLLEKAKKTPLFSRRAEEPTDEEIEVAMAWLKGEVRTIQIARAYGVNRNSNNFVYTIARWLREAYRRGRLEVKRSEK